MLVENYRPAVMPRAGLGFDALHEVNPRLIYAQLSGLGYDGPYAGRGGFDLIAQGMGGVMHVTGEPDGPPTSVGLPICDLGTGMWAVQGILAALYERQRTGVGRLVECSLLETAIGFSSWTSAQWLADHEEPTRQGSRHRQNAPYQRMRTKDGYLMVGAAGQAIWARCAAALGHPEWCEDPRFATNQERMANRAALEAEMNTVLTTQTTEHWVEVLDAAGVPCGPVYDYAQMFADPQVRHRGLVQYASDPELGEVPHIRTPIRIGEGVRVRTVAPRLGEHNAEIFGRLGVSEAEMRELCTRGVSVNPATSNFCPENPASCPAGTRAQNPGSVSNRPKAIPGSLSDDPNKCSQNWACYHRYSPNSTENARLYLHISKKSTT